MEAFLEWMLKEFAELRAAQNKLDVVNGICAQLEALDAKLTQQSTRLDQVQVKVDLSCDTLGRCSRVKLTPHTCTSSTARLRLRLQLRLKC